MTSKQRYDAKRRGAPERKRKERARDFVRKTLRLKKTARCSKCRRGFLKTVWHHRQYEDRGDVVELCYRCHRAEHPRPMPQDKRRDAATWGDIAEGLALVFSHKTS